VRGDHLDDGLVTLALLSQFFFTSEHHGRERG
jgi:hypothetical protein